MSQGTSIGVNGLLAAQQALDVVGTNIANANTAGYVRRRAVLASTSGNTPGAESGGVRVVDTVRSQDTLLTNSLNAHQGSLSQSTTTSEALTQMESIFGELSDTGLNNSLAEFFNSWQALAANPSDVTQRAVVVQQGQTVAELLNGKQQDLAQLQTDVQAQLRDTVSTANGLLGQLADNNREMQMALARGSTGASLSDQRDALISQITALAGGQVRTQADGTVSLSLDGVLVVDGVTHLNLSTTNDPATPVVISGDGQSTAIPAGASKMGALISLRSDVIPSYSGRLDELAGALVYQVNQLHSQGVGSDGGFTQLVGSNSVSDLSGANDAANVPLASAGLPFAPTAGNFTMNVTDALTGDTVTHTLAVNPATQSLSDIAAAISGFGDVSAAVVDGHLQITAGTNHTFNFAADQGTNLAAALGLNGFFTGSTAADIAVSDTLLADPSQLAAGRSADAGDGSVAQNVAALRDANVLGGGSESILGYWSETVTTLGADSKLAQTQKTNQQDIVDMLNNQRSSISGVSLDEEASDLLRYQQMYSSCANFIRVSSQLMTTLLSYLGTTA